MLDTKFCVLILYRVKLALQFKQAKSATLHWILSLSMAKVVGCKKEVQFRFLNLIVLCFVRHVVVPVQLIGMVVTYYQTTLSVVGGLSQVRLAVVGCYCCDSLVWVVAVGNHCCG